MRAAISMAWAWPQFILWLCLARCGAERPATHLGILSTNNDEAAPTTSMRHFVFSVAWVFQSTGFKELGARALGDYCGWPGITCHGSCVVSIVLGEDAHGQLPELWHFGNLIEVDISSMDVWGDLKVLEECTRLKFLNLRAEAMRGDIRALANMKWLEQFSLLSLEGIAAIEGDIHVLANMELLQEVQLSKTKVSGDIKVFNECKLLKYLYLDDASAIGGDIQVFEALPGIKALNLQGTQVYGDIQAFQGSAQLHTLVLASTQVYGDIRAFEATHKLELLQEVQLSKTKVSGDIKVFNECKFLKYLYLDDASAIGGDIQVFEALPGMKELNLRGTQVYGDIQAFQGSARLRALDLQGTQVYGDIRAFEATHKLEELILEATRISGNIQAFEKTKLLENLALSLTEVEGDIRVFNTTRHLQKLRLLSTKVCGDIVALQGATSLSELFLRSTNVQGDIEALTSTSRLEQLSLASSKVSGNVDIFNSSKVTAFRNLWKLELDHTDVVGNISFIGSLAQLLDVNLAATRISGDIDVFSRNKRLKFVRCQSTQVKGDIRSFEDLPHLTEVDMSFTNITGDVTVFAHKMSLHTLKLASTGIFGDIEDLVSGDNAFEVLELSSTSVVGNIWVFQHALSLREIYLEDTQVTGSMDGILHWEKVNTSLAWLLQGAAHFEAFGPELSSRQALHLRSSAVTTWIHVADFLKRLHLPTLVAKGSEVRFIPAGEDRVDLLQLPQFLHPEEASLQLLPALTTLEVSGCQLQGPVSDLLLPLAFCEHLGSVLARESGLTGDLPTTDPSWTCPGAAIPHALHSIGLSSNKQRLQLAENVLTKACRAKVLIDLKHTWLDNPSLDEIRKLVAKGTVNLSERRVFLRESEGYNCVDIDRSSTTLEVTPSKILPHEWCTCLQGWFGAGTDCKECPEDFFSDELNSSSCSHCPAHTNSSKRSTSVHDCHCQDRHLNCSGYSSNASTAQPLLGYARLELKAHEAFQCLDKKRCPGDGGAASGLGCGSGYDGPLCTGCHKTFFAAGNSCLPCSNKHQHLPTWLIHAMASVTIVALLWAGVVAVAYLVYSWHPGQWLEVQLQTLRQAVFAEGVVGSLQQKLLKSQAPVLLQMCQLLSQAKRLWVVLAVLASNKEKEGDEASSSRLWELPYMQTLQFAIGNLQELLYLQCYLGGPPVRLALAILTPVLPLALLLCSSGLEVFRRGAGVSAALKVLPIFFIGGASKCFALRSCQRFDAGGEQLENFAFLRQLPDLRCEQDVAWADSSPEQKLVSSVFWPCAICYGILIPCFLFYLYFRQHVLLRYSRVPLQLMQGGKEQHLAVGLQDRMLERRVVAAAVAYIAMMQQGTVRIQLSGGKGRLGDG
ncbi:ERECTA [Symbiodinium necroappetens]|uniref:ERECTA protein n=1 Tax=Symbiodinium necroappetens TaxID=1628268 RepID=A0A813AG96_9DINO|nr:ERECTA [Symbiodinium necroappetens]